MKGNEIKNHDTWIKVEQNRKRWKAMESEYATTAAAASVDSVHSRRCSPQDPIRPARYLNGVKSDDYQVVNFAWPPTKDQNNFDLYGLQTFYVDLDCQPKTREPRFSLQCSWSLEELKPFKG